MKIQKKYGIYSLNTGKSLIEATWSKDDDNIERWKFNQWNTHFNYTEAEMEKYCKDFICEKLIKEI
jgi:hypothetical protein